MRRATRVEDDFIELELMALARLCDHWGARWRQCRSAARKGLMAAKFRRKIPEFRKAVIRGEGGREAWEREFIHDELDVMKLVVSGLRNRFGTNVAELRRQAEEGRLSVPLDLDTNHGSVRIVRPLPGPLVPVLQALESLNDGRSDDSSIARRMVAARLRTTRGQIRDALGKARRGRTSTTPIQKLAASIIYDISLSKPSNAPLLRWRIFAGLVASGYPPICLYYLAQRAQTIDPLPRCPVISKRQVQTLCDALAAKWPL